MDKLRNKVIEYLIKCGNNKSDVEKMVDLHFDFASKNYSTVKTISQYIRIIY